MNQALNDCLAGWNSVGKAFCGYAAAAFVQSALLIIVLFALDLLLRKRVRAVFRYGVWLLVLVKLVLPPTLSLPTGIGYWVGNRLPVVSPVPEAVHGGTDYELVRPHRYAGPGPSGGTPEAQQSSSAMQEADTQVPPATRSWTPITWQAVVLLVWLVGVLAFATLLIQRLRFVRGLVVASAPAGDDLLNLLEECRQRMGIRGPVGLRTLDTLPSPAVCGLRKPMILMPTCLVEKLSLAGLRAALIHEVAHIKRADLWVNVVQTFLQVLYFYNPFVWFANAAIRRACEEAVDETVLVALGGEAKNYSNTLIDISEMAFWKADFGLRLVGVAESRKALQGRIKHMLTRPIPKSARIGGLGTIVILVVAAILLPMARAERSNKDAPVAPPVTGVSATETASLGGGLVTRRVLTDASGVGGVLTADGKYIRGIDWDTGDVVQFEVASGQRSRITNGGPWSEQDKAYQDQAFSRDGKQIAYNSATKDWVFQLRIRNLDGSGVRTLYSEKGSWVRPLDWSPDEGSILAVRDRNKAVELTLISTADGSVRVLRNIASILYSLESASFSPDGRFVAFSSMFEGSPPQGDVFLMTADGRNEVVVAGHPAEDKLLRWTPDGRSLVFLSDRSGTWDIWTVPITGGKQQGEPELLKKDFGYYSEVLGFAPDGSFYYKTDTALGGFYNGAVDLETGKVLVPSAPVTTRYTGAPSMPTWSPDGRNLLYLTRRGSIGPGNNILTIRSAATGEERFLSPRLRFVNQISWAPDGRSVIALGITETGSGAFRIDAETSVITKLAGDARYAPHLCPDGKTLVFVTNGPVITKRNLDTGEESEVVKGGTMFYDLSPDGREVVFQVDGAVKTVSLNGGEPRELFRGLAQSYNLEWTRDGRYIIAQARYTASSEIWRVPAQGGTPLKLDLSVPKLAFFTLHPDNRRFAFSVNEGSKSELWVLENFLPAGRGVKDSK
jgi:beta-lactamase regulating signal transducer with metallopeptidase domain/Tol biopolymer transport system component